MHNLKVVDYVLLSGPTEDLSPEAATQTTLREELFQRGKGESRIYEILQQKPCSWIIRKLFKEKPDISVNEFSIFSVFHNYEAFS